MRLRRKLSCAVVAGIGASSVGLFAGGCVGDDNAAPGLSDSGIDATTLGPDTSTPEPEAGEDTGIDSTVVTADAGEDSATVDASDASDSGTSDTGVDAGCAPSLAAGWTPPAYVPAAGRLRPLCGSSAEIDQFWTACFGDAAVGSACDGFFDAAAGTAGCAGCLLTPETASAYGAATTRVVPQINVAGCIEEADLSDAGFACAAAVQAVQTCTEAACLTHCPLTSDPATTAAYVACTNAATTTACSVFTTAAQACIAAELDAGGQAATTCLTSSSKQQLFDDIGVFFCES